jgi:hypothetical protein
MPPTSVVPKPALTETSPLISRSPELEHIQSRPDSPLGMQFLRVPASISPSSPAAMAQTTSSSEETSNDGSSKLDPVYDEDEEDDE